MKLWAGSIEVHAEVLAAANGSPLVPETETGPGQDGLG